MSEAFELITRTSFSSTALWTLPRPRLRFTCWSTALSAQELQENSPSPYGVFGIVLDGQLLAYHYLLRKDLDACATLIDSRTEEES